MSRPVPQADSRPRSSPQPTPAPREGVARRLLDRWQSLKLPPRSGVRGGLGAEQVDHLTDLVRYQGDEAIERFIHGVLARGHPAEAVCLDLLAPTARRFGEKWVADECSFAEVTIAAGRLQRVLRRISRSLVQRPPQVPLRSVLLACMPGAQHSLGLFMVAELLVAAGFEVTVGAPLTEGTPAEAVRHRAFDAVGLSLSCDVDADRARDEIVRLRRVSANPGVRVLVGGVAVTADAGLAADLGADGTATDARGAVGAFIALWEGPEARLKGPDRPARFTP